MDAANERLAHALKLQFGTAPFEPTQQQLDAIKQYIGAISARGKTPSRDDWAQAVGMFCPGAGRHKYAGIDNSDINTLLALATKKP
jgi:hypothetical protein